MMGFNQRYWEPVSKLRKLLHERARADVLSARFVMTSNVCAWQSISEVGDPLDDLGSHLFDLVRYIFAREIYSVSAQWDGRQSIEMRARLDGDIVAICTAAHSKVTRESLTICCRGERFSIRLGSERVQPAGGLIRRVLDFSDTVDRRVRGIRSSLRCSYQQQLALFLNCVRTGITPEPGIEDGIASIRAVEAARKSAAAGGIEVTV
jgi:predicted dehydrogenase